MAGEYNKPNPCECLVCGKKFDFAKKLANHLASEHDLKSRDYTIKYLYDGTEPTCLACNEVPRYVSFVFKKYCANHVRLAEAAGGRVSKPRKQHTKTVQAVPLQRSETRKTDSRVRFNRGTNHVSIEDMFQTLKSTLDVDVELKGNDIYVPSKKTLVVYNDLMSRTGNFDDDVFIPRRCENRLKTCLDEDVKLVQIFSDEWINKQDVCLSIIRNTLGLNKIKINARDCEIVELDATQGREFFDVTHISGYTRCSQRFALKHPTYGIVAAASLRRPIQKKWGFVVELARMSFALNTTVRGGAHRLLKRCIEAARQSGFEGFLSYADLRLGGGGNVYSLFGMEKVAQTHGNYWYTDGKQRYDRFRFRAQDGMTERDYALKHNVRQVFGAGNAVYLLRFSSPHVTSNDDV